MSTVAPSSLEAAYRALDPQEVLDPGATAYTPRPVAPLATLATQLRLADRSGTHLVSGHIGSGKTTELRRLEAELGSAVSARFVPLDAISADGELSTMEILVMLLVAAVSIADGGTLAEAAGSVEIPRPLRKKAIFTLGSRDRMPESRSGDLGQWLTQTPSPQNLEHDVVEAIRSASARAPHPPIVILDGLDKLSLNEIEPTLGRLLKWNLPITLVATVPLSYLFTPSFSRRESSLAGVHVVPALPVVQRDLQPNPNALAWFEAVLAGRGVLEIFDQDAIERITLMTAGIVRDFVRSCREAVLAALVHGRPRVDLEMATIALDEFALRMTRPVSGDDLGVLDLVAQTGRVVGHSTFLALIDGGQIVEYRNGSNWYAVHPLLRDIVGRFAEEIAS